MAPVLEVEHLSRNIAGRPVITDLSFTLEAGQTVTVTGASGSGKTTLLRLLVRLDPPDAGVVRLHGQDTAAMDPRALRRRMAYVAQDPEMLPGTVMDNLRAGPRLFGEEIDPEEARRVLRLLGLEGREEDQARELSAGQRLRVALARALQNRPDVLLLDEPTAKLDDVSRRRVEELLGDLVDRLDVGLVMVTHDDRQAERLGQNVVRLGGPEDGGPVARGVTA